MADEPEAERLDTHEEEEGGPVKSFLEHLEDLRWVLIKSITAAGVAMIACFFGGNYVVKVLKLPLQRAPVERAGKEQRVRILLGTNQLPGRVSLRAGRERAATPGMERPRGIGYGPL